MRALGCVERRGRDLVRLDVSVGYIGWPSQLLLFEPSDCVDYTLVVEFLLPVYLVNLPDRHLGVDQAFWIVSGS